MVSLIFPIIDIEVFIILPYISSYVIIDIYFIIANNISHYWLWNSYHTTLYKQLFYYFRIMYSELQILILGTKALFKIITTITIMIITTIIITKIMMISATIFQNITEKLEIFWHILFSHFFGFYCCLRCYMIYTGRKTVIKLQQIISQHKQAFIPMAI